MCLSVWFAMAWRNNQENLELYLYHSRQWHISQRNFLRNQEFVQLVKKKVLEIYDTVSSLFPSTAFCVLQFLKPTVSCFQFLIHLLLLSNISSLWKSDFVIHENRGYEITNGIKFHLYYFSVRMYHIRGTQFRAVLISLLKLWCPYQITVQLWGQYLTPSIKQIKPNNSSFFSRT